MSLGAGFKKVIDMSLGSLDSDEAMAESKERLAHVDDEGVTFKSHLDGSMHRFTPEISMQVQHQIGADIIFAFDELTTLHNTRKYQEQSLERTRLWAIRCLDEHKRLTDQRSDKPYQALFGVLQGAQYEDLRRKAAKDLSEMNSSGIAFDGFGIGGAQISLLAWKMAPIPLIALLLQGRQELARFIAKMVASMFPLLPIKKTSPQLIKIAIAIPATTSQGPI